MFVLAIDTSSAAVTAAVAAVDAAAVTMCSERVVVDARAHGECLAPLIQAALSETGIRCPDLGAIVAGVGPGPFTGLRVGLVTAGVMAELLGISTYGVPSLDAVAADHPGPVLVAGDARRREIYWGRYLNGALVEGPDVVRPAELPGLGGDAVLVGAGARLYADVLGGRLLDGDYPSPRALVERAAGRIRDAAPSERLIPLYLRRPDAVAPADYKPVSQSR